ncbi:MAG TPA: hypothetical protein VFI47_20350 [Acidimicrobiales bacterium]|nr:hypothetical protein [Acidimicrobiales bacterium]
MRTTKVVMAVAGVAMLVAGLAGGAWAATADSEAALGVGIMAATLGFVGVVFVLVARYLGGLDTTQQLRDGVPGSAQVLSTRDTGTIINGHSLVVELGLLVTVPGRPPYEAKVRHVAQGRTQWGAIQPGMLVGVKVDPADPARVVIDPDGTGLVAAGAWGGAGAHLPAGAGAAAIPGGIGAAGMPGGIGAAAMPGAGPRVVPVSAADIVARGVASEGRLEQAAPTGMTAGQVAQGLPAHEADDPVMHITFSYTGPGGQHLHQTALMRVPDGKSRHLTPGATLPVAYLPDNPEMATVDWARLRGTTIL